MMDWKSLPELPEAGSGRVLVYRRQPSGWASEYDLVDADLLRVLGERDTLITHWVKLTPPTGDTNHE